MRINYPVLRMVEWGRSYDWDIYIPSAPWPFDSWLPVANVEQTVFDISERVLEVGNRQIAVPEKSNLKLIQVTFFDSDKYDLHKFLESWFYEIFRENGVAPLTECCKLMLIDWKDTTSMLTIRESAYYVFPRGNLTFSGKSESEALVNTVEFVVVSEGVKYKEKGFADLPIVGDTAVGRIGSALGV